MSEVFFDGLAVALGLTHLAPLLAPVAYVRSERANRRAWEDMPLPARALDASIYRGGAPIVTGYVGRAPRVVRLAAASCFVFGAMFVPGAALAFTGLFAAGAGVLGLPGLVIAAKLWGAGRRLLGGTRRGAAEAATSAKIALWFNVVLVAGALVFCCVSEVDSFLPSAVALYALLSIGQALLVLRAARVLDRAASGRRSRPSVRSAVQPAAARLVGLQDELESTMADDCAGRVIDRRVLVQ